jgi:hypothetical protein
MPDRAAIEDPEIDKLLFKYALRLLLLGDNNAGGGEVGRFNPIEDLKGHLVVPQDPLVASTGGASRWILVETLEDDTV